MYRENSKHVLFLHIGMSKTGTTALQSCWVRNKKLLMTEGICYSEYSEYYHMHVNLLFNICREYIDKKNLPIKLPFYIVAKEPPSEIVQRMKHDFYYNNCHTMLISCEDFFYPLAITDSKDEFSDARKYVMQYLEKAFAEFEIKIVCYLRRQDDFLESQLNQILKTRNNRNDLADTIFREADMYAQPNDRKNNSRHRLRNLNLFHFWLDYYSNLSKLAEIYGKENIIVRPYEKGQLPEGIELDFFKNVLGLGNDLLLNLQISEPTNESIKPEINDFKMATGLFELSREFVEINDAPALARIDKSGRCNIIHAKQAWDIVASYAEGNSKIAREYLNREDGLLFYDSPRKEENDYEGLSLDAAIDISRELVHMIRKGILDASLYINYGEGYNEHDRIEKTVFFDESFCVRFELTGDRDIVGLRFDPDEKNFYDISIDSVLIDGVEQNVIGSNAFTKNDEYDSFFTNDPIYILSTPSVRFREVEICGRIRSLTLESVNILTNENEAFKAKNTNLLGCNEYLKNEIEKLTNDLNRIKRSRILRFASKFSKCRSLFIQ